MTLHTPPQGVAMPDTRLPDHWLGAPQFDGLSDTAWRIFTHGYMWSNRYLTDGWIPNKSLRHLGTERGSDGLLELEEAGLIASNEEGISLDWAFQTASETFHQQRKVTRERVARHRSLEKEQLSNSVSNAVTEPVTNAVSRRGEERRGEDEGFHYSPADEDDLF